MQSRTQAVQVDGATVLGAAAGVAVLSALVFAGRRYNRCRAAKARAAVGVVKAAPTPAQGQPEVTVDIPAEVSFTEQKSSAVV